MKKKYYARKIVNSKMHNITNEQPLPNSYRKLLYTGGTG